MLFCDVAEPACSIPTVSSGSVTSCSNDVTGTNVTVTFTVFGADNSMSAVMAPSGASCTLSKF